MLNSEQQNQTPTEAGMDTKPLVGGSYRIVTSNSRIDVPCSVAVCPYCDTKLNIGVDGWTEDEANPGYWIADMPSDVCCETEPDLDDEDWEDWFSSHSEMPYVYMLPVQSKIERWLKLNYRWVL